MKKLKEYKELLIAAGFVAMFFIVNNNVDPITAGASSDWLVRLPILGCVALLLPTITHWVWSNTFVSLHQQMKHRPTEETKIMIYITYAVTLLAIAILAHALV